MVIEYGSSSGVGLTALSLPSRPYVHEISLSLFLDIAGGLELHLPVDCHENSQL